MHPPRRWHPRTRRDPLLIGLEPDAKPVIEDAECSVAIVHDRLRHHGLHFLRHHADIGPITAVVAEAIVAEAIGKMTEQDDIVLERDVGPSATTATTTSTTAATTATAAATEAATTTAATEAAAATTAETAAADTRASTRGGSMSDAARSNISQGVAAASA
jgi:hypothetical protein